MKISYNWLKDYVDLDIDPQLLAEKLSLTGFEVEEVVEKRLDYSHVVVGKVLKVEKHPDAEKLTVCKVDVGKETLTIVCGAPNVAQGQVVAVARVGAQLPNGMKIGKARLRGVVSEGMICSRKELGVSEEADGIWVLPDQLTVGVPLSDALEFETDYILDIGVTPNRPDALCHIGIAREVAAILGRPLKMPEPHFTELGEKTARHVKVEILCPDSCPRYAARLIRNVSVGPSPTWLVRRLEAVGMRPINNIVDITNFVMMETCHPLHAFDFDLLEEGKIVVRESSEGEKFVTLDEKEHTLRQGTVLICDAVKPVAIGGIMGGLNSEVNQNTRNILLESAYFAPQSIQRSIRYLGINSEAAQRFERGADPNGVIYAQMRATELILKLAQGETYQSPVDAYPKKIFPVKIPLKHERINTLLGTRLSAEEMGRILQKIGLNVRNGKVVIPTFRPDLHRVADLAEEVARLYGLENIPAADQTRIVYDISRNDFDEFVDELKTIMVGLGLQETMTNSMINAEKYARITGERIYPILNPISVDMSGLRNNLILSMLGVMQWNLNRQNRDLRIFEINRVFYYPENLSQLPDEELHLGIAMTGKRDFDFWYSNRQLLDFYDIKGTIEALCAKISLDNIQFISYDNFAVDMPAVALEVQGQRIGYLGQLRSNLQEEFDIDTPVLVAELNVHTLYRLRKQEKVYQAIPRFPWVDRDLAFVVDEKLPVQSLIETIQDSGGELLQTVSIFDIYRGKQIEAGKKSVAVRLIFQSRQRTLTEEEVNQIIDRILNAVQKLHLAKLR